MFKMIWCTITQLIPSPIMKFPGIFSHFRIYQYWHRIMASDVILIMTIEMFRWKFSWIPESMLCKCWTWSTWKTPHIKWPFITTCHKLCETSQRLVPSDVHHSLLIILSSHEASGVTIHYYFQHDNQHHFFWCSRVQTRRFWPKDEGIPLGWEWYHKYPVMLRHSPPYSRLFSDDDMWENVSGEELNIRNGFHFLLSSVRMFVVFHHMKVVGILILDTQDGRIDHHMTLMQANVSRGLYFSHKWSYRFPEVKVDFQSFLFIFSFLDSSALQTTGHTFGASEYSVMMVDKSLWWWYFRTWY